MWLVTDNYLVQLLCLINWFTRTSSQGLNEFFDIKMWWSNQNKNVALLNRLDLHLIFVLVFTVTSQYSLKNLISISVDYFYCYRLEVMLYKLCTLWGLNEEFLYFMEKLIFSFPYFRLFWLTSKIVTS